MGAAITIVRSPGSLAGRFERLQSLPLRMARRTKEAITTSQRESVQLLREMLEAESALDRVRVHLEKARTLLKEGGYSDEVVRLLLPFAEYPRLVAGVQNFLLLDWIESGVEKRFVVQAAIEAKLIDRSAAHNVTKAFDERIRRARRKLASLKRRGITLDDLTRVAYERVHMRRLELQRTLRDPSLN
jgi:hypothetical protein